MNAHFKEEKENSNVSQEFRGVNVLNQALTVGTKEDSEGEESQNGRCFQRFANGSVEGRRHEQQERICLGTSHVLFGAIDCI